MTDITIRSDLRPGDLGRLITLHGVGYRENEKHFGLKFEAFVARTIAEFIIDNDGRGKIWMAEQGGELVACAAIVERRVDHSTLGQLRWIVAKPSVRGKGLGEKLVSAAIDHARNENWSAVYLETTDGLNASMGLYRKLGFNEVDRDAEALWREENTIITMRLDL